MNSICFWGTFAFLPFLIKKSHTIEKLALVRLIHRQLIKKGSKLTLSYVGGAHGKRTQHVPPLRYKCGWP